jgi:hypothetical protein
MPSGREWDDDPNASLSAWKSARPEPVEQPE